MRKVFLIVAACLMACLTQTAAAYEYSSISKRWDRTCIQVQQSHTKAELLSTFTLMETKPQTFMLGMKMVELNGSWPGGKMTETCMLLMLKKM